ncbi:hypothetical protein B0J14DRAFT_689270 [Halenospora varia]|nr:hypothetical protein B0J14DRAFT_689270 [Halenospora varia]
MFGDRDLEVDGEDSEYHKEAMEGTATQDFLDSIVLDEMQAARLYGDVAEMRTLLITRNLPPGTDPSREMHLTLNNAITWRSQRNDMEKVRELFKYFVDDPTIPGLMLEELSLPLKSAIEHENRDMVNILLCQGARITKESEDQLYLKTTYNLKTFRLILDNLLRSGWDLDRGSLLWYAAASACWGNQKPPAMYYIALKCSPATLQLCFDNGSKVYNGAFVAAARRKSAPDRIAIFEILLKYGGDINCVEELGLPRRSFSALQASQARTLRATALYAAVKAEDVELIQWLMEHGANPLVRVFRGDLPAGTPAGILRSSTNLVLRDMGKKFCD